MKGISKLRGKPVSVEIFLEYEDKNPTETEIVKKEYEPKAGTEVKAWIHPMDDDDAFDVEAVGMEAFRTFRERGAEDLDANWKAERVKGCQQVFYCVRVSEALDSKRLFETTGEVIDIPYPEIQKILMKYNENFVPTVEERKNSLRARIGNGSKTESSSPNTSKAGD